MQTGGTLWLIFGCACAALGAGVLGVRASRIPRAWSTAGWIAFFAGVCTLAWLALAELRGRFGPDHLWFREPTFHLSAAVLACAAAWWLARPAPRALRFGLPAAALALLMLAGVVTRLDGQSAPLAMLMPTLERRAPDFGFIDDRGQRRRLSELGGKVVLLNFWATWCAPCRHEMPMLSGLQRKHADDGLVVLFVSLERPEVLEPFLATHHFEGIVGRLDDPPAFYDAGKFYPLSYLISRDGRVLQRWSGRPKQDWLQAQLARALDTHPARVAKRSQAPPRPGAGSGVSDPAAG